MFAVRECGSRREMRMRWLTNWLSRRRATKLQRAKGQNQEQDVYRSRRKTIKDA
jgi:hypothetical protein